MSQTKKMIQSFRESIFRLWYWYVSKVDKKAEVLFMNYGYNDESLEIKLDEANESNRYSIQLYHHLATEVELLNKNIVEIGCGRGGGLFYIAKNFKPATAIGVDMNNLAISFCKQHYKYEGLWFVQGDAQSLNLDDNSVDVIFNVESSHRYPNMAKFLSEVSRILRPNGTFLFTDFRYNFEMDKLIKNLNTSGLTIVKERIINNQVVSALRLDDERRRSLVKRLTPRIIHRIALNFAGAIGSETFKQFDSQKYIYFSYVLKKA